MVHHFQKMYCPNQDRPSKVNKKAPGALDPAVFPFPSWCKIHYGHSRYEPKWCKFMKLVIYPTFDVFATTPPPSPRLFCTLLLVITWILNSMITFPIPHFLVIHLFKHSRKKNVMNSLTIAWLNPFFLTNSNLSVILNLLTKRNNPKI